MDTPNLIAMLDMREFDNFPLDALNEPDDLTVVVTQGESGGQEDVDAAEIETYVASRYMGAREAHLDEFRR